VTADEAIWSALDAWHSPQLGEPLIGGSMNHVREVEVDGRQCVARISGRGPEDLDSPPREAAVKGRLHQQPTLGTDTRVLTVTDVLREDTLGS
jgi:hypothetical protein